MQINRPHKTNATCTVITSYFPKSLNTKCGRKNYSEFNFVLKSDSFSVSFGFGSQLRCGKIASKFVDRENGWSYTLSLSPFLFLSPLFLSLSHTHTHAQILTLPLKLDVTPEKIGRYLPIFITDLRMLFQNTEFSRNFKVIYNWRI